MGDSSFSDNLTSMFMNYLSPEQPEEEYLMFQGTPLPQRKPTPPQKIYLPRRKPPVPSQGVDDPLFSALIQQESGGNPNAVSNKGALGIAQVMPATAMQPGFGVPSVFDIARTMGRRVKTETREVAKDLLRDPDINTMFGKAYLNTMIEKNGGDINKALAAYNGGPIATEQAVAKAQGKKKPHSWLKFMPEETRNYVPGVLNRTKK